MAKLNVTDQKTYSQSFGGSQHNAILLRGSNTDPTKDSTVLYRCASVRWNTDRSVSQADEINTPRVKETNYNREELTRGTMDVVFTLGQNDAMPSANGLWDEDDMMIIVYINKSGKKYITDVFKGVKLSNDGSGVQVGQNRIMSTSWISNEHIRGIDAGQPDSTYAYPANVS